MRAHGVVDRDDVVDRVDDVGHRRKHGVEIEFVFQDAVNPFGDRILITVILVGHTGEPADRGELLEVVMATVLGGFNRSSQHLVSEDGDGEDRQAEVESIDPEEIEITGSATRVGQGRTATVLGGDCP